MMPSPYYNMLTHAMNHGRWVPLHSMAPLSV